MITITSIKSRSLNLTMALALVVLTLLGSAQRTMAQKKTVVASAPFFAHVEGPSLPLISDPGDCPEINWPLDLEGTIQTVTTVTTLGGGINSVNVHTIVKGTATDADSNTFTFIYVTNVRTTTDPNSGELVVNFLTDLFSMHGETGTINVGLIGSLILDADGNFLGIDVQNAHGNYACDPI